MFSWPDELPVDPTEAADCGERSEGFCETLGRCGGGAASTEPGDGPSSDATPVGARNSAFNSRCIVPIASFGEGRVASANEGDAGRTARSSVFA